MESGEVITVVGGKITAIVTPASDEAKDQQIADLKAQLESLQATNQTLTETNNTLTADVDALKSENENIAKNVTAIESHLKTLNIDFKAQSLPLHSTKAKRLFSMLLLKRLCKAEILKRKKTNNLPT